MDIEYRVLKQVDQASESEAIWEILCACSHEFVPPLTGRKSSTQSELGAVSEEDTKPYAYFEKMIKQSFILAVDNEVGRVVGFMTFIPDYESSELGGYNPSNYISTVCVSEEYRNLGITRGFYNVMLTKLDRGIFTNEYISTRTWSTNDAHLHVLDRLGFETVTQLKDHRGPGIDTVYLAARVSG